MEGCGIRDELIAEEDWSANPVLVGSTPTRASIFY